MNYLKRYQDMIRLRGLTDNTVKNYSTYITELYHLTKGTVLGYTARHFLPVV